MHLRYSIPHTYRIGHTVARNVPLLYRIFLLLVNVDVVRRVSNGWMNDHAKMMLVWCGMANSPNVPASRTVRGLS